MPIQCIFKCSPRTHYNVPPPLVKQITEHSRFLSSPNLAYKLASCNDKICRQIPQTVLQIVQILEFVQSQHCRMRSNVSRQHRERRWQVLSISNNITNFTQSSLNLMVQKKCVHFLYSFCYTVEKERQVLNVKYTHLFRTLQN